MHAVLWREGDPAAAAASLRREHHILDVQWEAPLAEGDHEDEPPLIKSRIDSMTALLLSHFANEEALMRTLRFPGYADHKAEHRRIAVAFDDVLINVPGSSPRWGPIFVFLREWTADHALAYDRRLDTFMARSLTAIAGRSGHA